MHDIIKALCARDNITWSELSRQTGIAPSTWTMMKVRGSYLNPELMYRVAKYFGVSMEYLMGVEEEKANA